MGAAGRAGLPEAVHEELADRRTVLFLLPDDHPDRPAACIDHLVREDPAATNVLWIDFGRRPTDRLAEWRRFADDSPAESVLVAAHEGPGGIGDRGFGDGTPMVEPADPRRLADLGTTVTDTLQMWVGVDRRVAFCWYTLTALLEYADPDTAFEFLHVLTGQLRSVGADAHFHLDPDAHGEAVVRRFRALFDAAVAVEDGGYTVEVPTH